MKDIRFLGIISVLLLGYIYPNVSQAIQFPVVATQRTNNTLYTYTLRLAEYATPPPITQSGSFSLYVCYPNAYPSDTCTRHTEGVYSVNPSTDSWERLGSNFFFRYSSGSFFITTNRPGPYCAGFGISPMNTQSVRYDSVLFFDTCHNIPPSNVSCDLQTTDLTLDHGSLGRTETEGATSSGNVTINCSAPVSVSLRAQPNIISLAPSLNSTLSIAPIPTPAPAGLTTTAVTSTLSGSAPAGAYQGQSILLVDYL